MRLILDPLGVKELAHEPGTRACVVSVTASLADAARAGSPVVTGHFSGSFGTTVDTEAAGPVGVLSSSDVGATAIEFGSVNNRPYAPVRRAVRTLGLRLVESR